MEDSVDTQEEDYSGFPPLNCSIFPQDALQQQVVSNCVVYDHVRNFQGSNS